MILSEIKKNSKLLIIKTKYSVMNLVEYRYDMLVTSIGTYGYMFIVLIFLNFILNEFGDIGGWTRYEVLALFVTTQFVFYTFFAFFYYIVDDMSADIEIGEFDKFLTKPVNLLFNISTGKIIVVQNLPGILFAIVIAVIAVMNLNIDLANVPLYFITLAMTFTLYYLIALCISLLSFWITDNSGLIILHYRAFSDLAKFPATIYPTGVRFIFFTILPIALIAYVPTDFLLHGFNLDLFILLCGTLFMFVLITWLLWIRGLKKYSSASS